MKIVQVSTLYPPELFSGGTLVPHRIAHALMQRGHEVSVFSGSCVFGDPLLTEKTWVYEGVPVHAVTVTSGYAQGVPNYRNTSVAALFDRFLARVQPDVVHFHSIQALGADILEVPRRHGAASVVTMHDGWFFCTRQFMFADPPRNRMCPWKVDSTTCDCVPGFDLVERRRYLEACLQHVDRVLAVSEPFRRVVRENGVPSEKLLVSENGVPPVRPLPRTPSRRVRFGYLPGPSEWKGARTIAHALQLLDRDVEVQLFGFTEHSWRDTGGKSPDARVVFKPRFQPADVPAMMAELDVLLVTSIGMETFSIATREGLQYGLPVISSRCLGPEGIIRDGENGLLYERGDSAQLATAMKRFADDRAFLARACAAASATPIRTVEEQISETETIYRTLMESRPARPKPRPPLPRSVLFLGGMDGAPFRYRVTDIAEQLEHLGVQATCLFHHDERALALAGKCQVVILNRIPWDAYTDLIVRRARAAGALLVFAIDDLIFDPALEIPALKGLPRSVARSYRNGLRLFRRTFQACDAFLGSTATLTDAAKRAGKPAFVHPNTLGLELGRISEQARQQALADRAVRSHGEVRIGYFSGSHAHDCDFEVAVPALAAVLAAQPRVQLVLGGHLRIPKLLEPFSNRIERLPFVAWRELPRLLAGVDICIAPLETPSVFNDAKSVLKWFEAAAVGVPTVASPTLPFREAIRHGQNGMLCTTTEEWTSALLDLVQSSERRARLAETARQDVQASFSFQGALPVLDVTMRELLQLSPPGPLRWVRPIGGVELECIRDLGVGIGRPSVEPRDAVAGPSQLLSTGVTSPIAGRNVVYQPIFPPDGVLQRIDLLVGTYGRIHRYDLHLRIVDHASGEELARAMVPAEHASDNTWLAFDVGAVETRAGRQLLIILEGPGARREQGLSVYCHHAGWPSGAGWCGPTPGINLTYRTWMRASPHPSDGATISESASARVDDLPSRLALLERRLAVAGDRFTPLAILPRRFLEKVKDRRRRRSARSYLFHDGGPLPSLPNRAVRWAVLRFTGSDDVRQTELMMDRIRATAVYRAGRWAYRRWIRKS